MSFVSSTDPTYDERALSLIRIGQEAIAVEDDAALDVYFARDFMFHGPSGDLDYDQLKSLFASMRGAFDSFSCERSEVICSGDLVAARTTMSGVFVRPFEMSPVGPLEPNGLPIVLELINMFRYDQNGRLAEEWVQFDNFGFLKQLGVTFTKD